MNQTDKIMRQYFVQYPILKSVENYQCLVNFISVFELLILFLCLLLFSWQSLLYGQPILQHFLYNIINKYCTVLVYTRDRTKASTRSPKHTMVNRTTHGK